MRRQTFTIGFVLTGLVLAGCGGSGDDPQVAALDAAAGGDAVGRDPAADEALADAVDERIDDLVEGGLGQDENTIDDDGDGGAPADEKPNPLSTPGVLDDFLAVIEERQGVRELAWISILDDRIQALDTDGYGHIVIDGVLQGAMLEHEHVAEGEATTVALGLLTGTDIPTIVERGAAASGIDVADVAEVVLIEDRARLITTSGQTHDVDFDGNALAS